MLNPYIYIITKILRDTAQTAGSPRLYVVIFCSVTAGWYRNFWLLLRTCTVRTSGRMLTIFIDVTHGFIQSLQVAVPA